MPHHWQDYDAIPGFKAVAPSIFEHTPHSLRQDDRPGKTSAPSPSLVILCSWTGAQANHVAKYTSQYELLFPNTRILVITTTTKDICFRSSTSKQRRLQPAIECILSYGDQSDILMHVFSEGGSNKAVELAEAFHGMTGSRLPCSALVLDSTPGHARFRRLCKALQKSLPPNPLVTCFGILLGAVVLSGVWTFHFLTGGKRSSPVERTRMRLMDEQFWNLSMPRCYLYSTTDEMIDHRDVRQHMEEAMLAGVPVMDVLFQDSDHCKHAVEDPVRYWNAVMMVWRRGIQAKNNRLLKKWGVVMVTEV